MVAPVYPQTEGLSSAQLRARKLAGNGQWQAAEAICHAILDADAARADTHLLLGVIYQQTQRAAQAGASIERSIALDADQPLAYALLGDAYLQLARASDALRSYDEALRRDPSMLPALFGRANALFDLARFEEAIGAYDRLLSRTLDHAEGWFNRGNAQLALGRFESAVQSYDKAIGVRARYAAAFNNRGRALFDLDQLTAALRSFEAAIAADEQLTDAYRNRALTLYKLGRRVEALEAFERVLRANAEDNDAEFGRSSVLFGLGRQDEALSSVNLVLARVPDHRRALRHQGMVLSSLLRHGEAASSHARLLELDPDDQEYAAGALHYAQRWCADWTPLHPSADPQKLLEAVKAGHRADVPFSFLSVTDDPEAQLRCARTYVESRSTPRESLAPTRVYRHARIRVAYVSGDFRIHPVAHLLTGVLEQHDRRRFEIIGISLRPAESSPIGNRIRSAFDRFVDVEALGDRGIAELIRGLEIDIAVDLMGHTTPRFGVMAYRPAPVQVQYLGFPGTMGAPFIDYTLADSFVVPPDTAHCFSERLVYLPDCFQANDSLRPAGDVKMSRRDAGLPMDAFVFCCFNNIYKLSAPVFDAWMRLLHRVPGSILWLFALSDTVAQNLRCEARRRDVNPDRLIFAPRVSYDEHLARLPLADLFLDTLPFGGGATTSDALWRGLPVLTCVGRSFAARMSGSLLHTLELDSLITRSFSAYEDRAVELAQQSGALAAARQRLRDIRGETPLFDSERFSRHLERAYERMHRQSAQGDAPTSFAVER